MLPLIGRIADLRGRVPVLVMALVVFALGSLVTALAYDMPLDRRRPLPPGRRRRRAGARHPRAGRRPLPRPAPRRPARRSSRRCRRSAASSARSSARWCSRWPTGGRSSPINLAVGLVLAAAIRTARARRPGPAPDRAVRRAEAEARLTSARRSCCCHPAWPACSCSSSPSPLMQDLTWGQLFIPFAGDGRWLTPVGWSRWSPRPCSCVRCLTARRPLVDLRGWGRSMRRGRPARARCCWRVALAGVILAFATADPKVQVFSDQGRLVPPRVARSPPLVFVRHLRRAAAPLVPHGALRRTPAWGSLLVSFFVGAALIAALIDIPLFARTTIYPDSQLDGGAGAGAVPGRAAGRRGARRLPHPSAPRRASSPRSGWRWPPLGFLLMSRWELTTLEQRVGQHPAGPRRLRLRAGAGAGQRRGARQHRRRRARARHRAGRGRPDGRHAGRHLGTDHDRAAALLRRAGRRPHRPRGVRRARAAARSSHCCSRRPGSPRSRRSSSAPRSARVAAGVLALLLFRTAATRGLAAGDLLRSAG